MIFSKQINAVGNNKKAKLFFFVVCAFVAGILAGYLIFGINAIGRQNDAYQVRQGNYRYINPLIECEVSGNLFQKYKPFENETRQKIAEAMAGTDNSSYAVYFRNLNNGPWFGINEDEKYMPASLLKVPLMIAYLKESESDPEILKKEFIVDAAENPALYQEIRSSVALEDGKSYSAGELIRRMIAYSDNQATQILLHNIAAVRLNEIYKDLDISVPSENSAVQDFMSVKSYASFFRILYNAAYLNRDNSEKALSLLAESDYKNALAAGVPPGIAVAHKFGEYGSDPSGRYPAQLHDCGIVYIPDYPYLLCVMTRGRTIKENEATIAKISSIVHEEVVKIYGSN